MTEKSDFELWADLEQGEKGLEIVARLVATYYRELVREGLPENVIAGLTAVYQTQLMGLGRRDDDEKVS